MSDYYIKGIMLKNCSYSIRAEQLLSLHNIKHKLTWIDSNMKDIYITNQIDTFPQIYLKKYNSNQNLLLGGCDDLAEFITTFKFQKINENDINTFMNKYKWSKKASLRLIQLINTK